MEMEEDSGNVSSSLVVKGKSDQVTISSFIRQRKRGKYIIYLKQGEEHLEIKNTAAKTLIVGMFDSFTLDHLRAWSYISLTCLCLCVTNAEKLMLNLNLQLQLR